MQCKTDICIKPVVRPLHTQYEDGMCPRLRTLNHPVSTMTSRLQAGTGTKASRVGQVGGGNGGNRTGKKGGGRGTRGEGGGQGRRGARVVERRGQGGESGDSLGEMSLYMNIQGYIP